MCYDVMFFEVTIEVGFFLESLSLQLDFVVSLRLFKSICEKLHVVPSPPNIFFNLLPNNIVMKILVPNTFFLNTQRMIILEKTVLVLHVRYDYEIIFEPLIHFSLLLHDFLPLGRLSR